MIVNTASGDLRVVDRNLSDGNDGNDLLSDVELLYFENDQSLFRTSGEDFQASLNYDDIDGSNGYVIKGIEFGDFIGDTVAGGFDLNADGIDDYIIGAPLSDPGGNTDAGSAYVVFGSANSSSATFNLTTLNGSNGFVIEGAAANDSAGASVANLGDVNGDGIDDIAFIANKSIFSSDAYILFGSGDGFAPSINLTSINGINGFRVPGIVASGPNPIISAAGDINNDGIDDFLIGASGFDTAETLNVGQVYLIFGSQTGFGTDFDLDSLDGSNGIRINLAASGTNSHIGRSLGGNGDVNGDGIDDIIIGSSSDGYVVFGTDTGFTENLELGSLDGTNGFVVETDRAFSVDILGDINRDGFDEVIIGDPNASIALPSKGVLMDIGLSVVVYGDDETLPSINADANAISNNEFGGADGFAIIGRSPYDRSGQVVANGGDINGDGFGDILIGANVFTAGQFLEHPDDFKSEAYVLFGSASGFPETLYLDPTIGDTSLDILDGNRGFLLQTSNRSEFSYRIQSAGDINGDGFDDVIVGGPGAARLGGNSTAPARGEVYILYGHAVAPSIGLEITGDENDNILDGTADDDVINGLSGDDILNGLGGNDVLNGGVGADQLNGGLGGDIYRFPDLSDTITELAGEGYDTIEANISFVLPGNVEELQLFGSALNGDGNDLNNVIFGSSEGNTLRGFSGDDDISGLSGDDFIDGGLGNDSMTGGPGNDTYVVDSSGDSVAEQTGGGIDTIISSVSIVSFRYPFDVENLILTGTQNLSASANRNDNDIKGNVGNNTIFGDDGDDVINGRAGDDQLAGGDDDDLLIGGEGDDILIGGEDDDVLHGGAGNDILYALSSSQFASDSFDDDILNGGDGDDMLFGNRTPAGDGGFDILRGGAGNDIMTLRATGRMEGGPGDDIYFGSTGSDVIEREDEGIDTVHRFANGPLTIPDHVENLVYSSGTGSNRTITGNELDNEILWNSAFGAANGNDIINAGAGNDIVFGGNGNDTISGEDGKDILNGENGDDTISGGAGDDTLDGGGGSDELRGGTGDDIYYYDPNDTYVELAGEGYDILISSTVVALPANFEELVVMTSNISGGPGDDTLNGTPGDDNINGQAGNDTINGLGGNDFLQGGIGDDELNGGDGDDELHGNDGIDTLNGDDGNDLLRGFFDDDMLDGGLGDDTLRGESGNDMLTGGAGNDRLVGGVGTDTLIGGTGDDSYFLDATDIFIELAGEGIDRIIVDFGDYTLPTNFENLTLTGTANINGVGNTAANVIIGNGANNILSGLGGDDNLIGGAGNDTLNGGSGADMLSGGAGNDIYSFPDMTDTIIEQAGQGIDTVRANVSFTLSDNVEILELLGPAAVIGTGNAQDNEIYGSGADNIIDGGAGADYLVGGTGNDTYIVDNVGDQIVELAGGGIDNVQASADIILSAHVENVNLTGIDDINATGNDLDNVINGNAGDNILNGKGGADSLAGLGGNDIYFINNVGDIAAENENGGIDEIRVFFDYTLDLYFENLILNANATSGTGNELNNVITGNGVGKTLNGLGGNDTIYGSAGVDTINGGDDNDILFGRQGNDTLNGGTGNDILNGQGNSDILNGGDGNDILRGDDGQDVLNGGAGNDNLSGGALIDILSGGDGLDVLFGDDGNDQLDGGAGLDRLSGGAGRDFFTGGDGNDFFRFADGDFSGTSAVNSDRIFDFSQGQGDIIQLDQVDAIAGGGDDAFTFVGTSAFSGTAGELRYEQGGAYTLVQGDTDGDGTADFGIRLDGLHALVEGDFIL